MRLREAVDQHERRSVSAHPQENFSAARGKAPFTEAWKQRTHASILAAEQNRTRRLRF
jgi:hypothetical protein